MKPFSYLEPTSIPEAAQMLAEHCDQARVLAGGTDLVVQMRNGTTRPRRVINLGFIPGLNYIDQTETGLRIGAMTPVHSIEISDTIRQTHPALADAASHLGSVAIRQVATLGGNLCNASPSADLPPSLIAFSALAKIVGPTQKRIIPIEEFFVGPGKTVLQPGELLVEVQVPFSSPRTGGWYIKHEVRNSMDLAIVGIAAVITLADDGKCRDARIALGAVGPTPIRAKEAEQIIRGKSIDQALIDRCADTAAAIARPISDVRASAEYRKEMVKVLTAQALRQALQEALDVASRN